MKTRHKSATMSTQTIYLPEALKDRLRIEARLRGVSMSGFVRSCLEADLKQKRPSLYERTKDLCGSVSSGIPDLATNPKYMKGFGEWRK